MQQSGRFCAFLLQAVTGLWLLLAAAPALPAYAAADVRKPAHAADSIAVVYPDLANPYRDIFNAIIAGIEERARVPVHRYPLDLKADTTAFGARLGNEDSRVVIALGRQGLQAAARLDADIGVVAGGVLSLPGTEGRSISGISLTPDPAVLFARLKSLVPGVKRVIVIYNPQHSGWLMALAQTAARNQGLELVAQEARDFAAAARLYETAFATADGRRDAIWLPQDPTTANEDTLLPLVLKQAWSHGVPVFSSSFPHVRKGVLFALYPDNRELGRNLADQAQALLAGGARAPGLLPLRAVLTAVNLRTASHLGLHIDYPQQRRFDFVFPEP